MVKYWAFAGGKEGANERVCVKADNPYIQQSIISTTKGSPCKR